MEVWSRVILAANTKLTKDEPSLAELQVYAEIGVEADIRDGDVSAWFAAQSSVLPATVPDTWKTRSEKGSRETDAIRWDKSMSGSGCPDGTGVKSWCE